MAIDNMFWTVLKALRRLPTRTPVATDIIPLYSASGTEAVGKAALSAIVALVPSSGDVVGPASATDNAVARFNSTTGKVIQDSPDTHLSDNAGLSLFGSDKFANFYNVGNPDAAAKEYVTVEWSSNHCYIRTQSAGGASNRPMTLVAGNTGGSIALATDGAIAFNNFGVTPYWSITSAGHFLAAIANIDIGASGATSPRTVYVTTSYAVGATKVIGAQGAAVADATDEASTMARLNDLLARVRTHGLIAT